MVSRGLARWRGRRRRRENSIRSTRRGVERSGNRQVRHRRARARSVKNRSPAPGRSAGCRRDSVPDGARGVEATIRPPPGRSPPPGSANGSHPADEVGGRECTVDPSGPQRQRRRAGCSTGSRRPPAAARSPAAGVAHADTEDASAANTGRWKPSPQRRPARRAGQGAAARSAPQIRPSGSWGRYPDLKPGSSEFGMGTAAAEGVRSTTAPAITSPAEPTVAVGAPPAAVGVPCEEGDLTGGLQHRSCT